MYQWKQWKSFVPAVMTIALVGACSSHNNPQELAEQTLSAPNLALGGLGAGEVDQQVYIFADSTGAITSADNTFFATFGDPYLPLRLSSTSLMTDTTTTGTCTTLTALTASLTGSPEDEVITHIGATGCSDQAKIKISVDTSQVSDAESLKGTGVVAYSVTVDLAPKVTTVAAGNTEATGQGTDATAGVFTVASDNSIVVTFSKSLISGTLAGTLSGASGTTCTAAHVGNATIVPGTTGLTVAWPVTGASGVTLNTACTFNVSGTKDLAGNKEDPNDTNITMPLTFE